MTILVVHSDGSVAASLKRCMEAAGLQVVDAGEVQDQHGLTESEVPMLVLLRVGSARGENHRDCDTGKTERAMKVGRPDRMSEATIQRAIGQSVAQGSLSREQGAWLLAALLLDSGPHDGGPGVA